MGMYIILLFILFNLDIYLKFGMGSTIAWEKIGKLALNYLNVYFSIEIIKVQVLYIEDVCNICSLY